MRKELREIWVEELILTESEDDNYLGSIRFVASVGDKKNANNRIYPSNILKREAEKFMKNIGGQLNHPADGNTELDKVSHVIDKLEYDKDSKALVASARILKTTSGQDLMKLVKSGVKLGASTRGFGTVTKKTDKDEEYLEINDDFSLSAVDIVSSPSFGSDTAITADNLQVFESIQLEEKFIDEAEEEAVLEMIKMYFHEKFEMSSFDNFKEYLKSIWTEEDYRQKILMGKHILRGEIKNEDELGTYLRNHEKLETKEDIREELLRLKKAEDQLLQLFDEAVQSGYKGSFKQWKETYYNEN